MIILRAYQSEALQKLEEALKEKKDALCVLPTASGKTEIMMSLVRSIHSSGKVIVILNRIKLYEQTVRRFKAALPDLKIGNVCGTLGHEDMEGEILIGTISSLNKRKHLLGPVKYVVLDEAHRASSMAESSIYGRFFSDLRALEAIQLIGFTATPFRSAGKIYGGPYTLFKEITYRRDMQEFIDDGFLAEPKLKSSKNAFDTSGLKIVNGDWDQHGLSRLTSDVKLVQSQIADALSRSRDRKKIIWMCANIKHAELVYHMLLATQHAALIHSGQSQEEQRENQAYFENTEKCRHLVFITICSEGWDFPPADCAVLMRPTRSAVLYVQVCGRILRTHPGKTDALILDYGRVIENCGPLNDPIILRGNKKDSEKALLELGMRTMFCKACLSYIEAPFPEDCPECGAQLIKPKTIIPKIDKKPEEFLEILRRSDANGCATTQVKKIIVVPYTSRAGNECYRVDYYDAPFHHAFSEYLLKDPCQYSFYKTKKRLDELGVQFPNHLTVQNVPWAVTYRKNDQGYKEIVRLHFKKLESTTGGDLRESNRK